MSARFDPFSVAAGDTTIVLNAAATVPATDIAIDRYDPELRAQGSRRHHYQPEQFV